MPKFRAATAVIDTSCLLNLLHLGLLPNLVIPFGTVFIPKYVQMETRRRGKGRYSLQGALRAYSFLKRCTVGDPVSAKLLYDTELNPDAPIHRGEAEAIIQARERSVLWILVDDLDARETAVKHSLRVMGTLGLLKQFKLLEVITEVKPLIDKLKADVEPPPRLSEQLIKQVLEEVGET